MEFSAHSRRLGPGSRSIRGPRPQSEKWPTVGRSPKTTRCEGVGGASFRADVPPRARLSPEEVRAGTSTKVSRLQAALTSLGPNDHGERAVLEVSLRKTQQQATVPPVAGQAEQIESEKTVVQCRGVGPVGSRMENRVRQRVARSRVAFGKAPCSGHRTDGLPRTHETQQARHSGSTPVGSGERTVMGS